MNMHNSELRELIAAAKGALDCLNAIPPDKRGNHEANIKRQIARLTVNIFEAERYVNNPIENEEDRS
jgi:hypothetical protein